MTLYLGGADRDQFDPCPGGHPLLGAVGPVAKHPVPFEEGPAYSTEATG